MKWSERKDKQSPETTTSLKEPPRWRLGKSIVNVKTKTLMSQRKFINHNFNVFKWNFSSPSFLVVSLFPRLFTTRRTVFWMRNEVYQIEEICDFDDEDDEFSFEFLIIHSLWSQVGHGESRYLSDSTIFRDEKDYKWNL